MEPEYSSARDISKDWGKIRLRFLLSENLTNGLFKKAEFWGQGRPIVNVSDVYGHDDTINLSSLDKISCDDAEYQRYSAIDGDFFFVRSSLALDGIGKTAMVSGLSEEVVFECHLVRGRPDKEMVNPRFLNYCLNSASSKAYFKSVANLVTMATIDQMKLKNLQLLLPCLDEQQKIATFLDHKTQQIDQLIEKKKTLIEKLEEQRIAVITQAVTKGLDKDVKLVPSGVDWLGDVPEHWDVLRAKFVSSTFVPQRNKPLLNSSEGIPWITMDDMSSDFIEEARLFVKEEHCLEAGSKILKSGAVIASCVGNFGITSINKNDVIINQQLQAFVVDENKINNEYLREVIKSSKVYFELIGTAATLVYVNQLGFDNVPTPMPPLDEQNEIVTFLGVKKGEFSKMIGSVQRAIKKLQEYRSALITAAVTGKIDVRDWQAPTEIKQVAEIC